MTHYQEIVRRVAESIKEESFSFLSSLVPIPPEDEMVAVVYSRWSEDNRYGRSIVNHPDRPPLKDSVSSIILNLKLLFPKIEDFRKAKEIISLYEHNRLETAYLQVSLGRFAAMYGSSSTRKKRRPIRNISEARDSRRRMSIMRQTAGFA